MTLQDFLTLDLPPLAASVLVGATCGLLGSFLLLRRESLVGDALSHAVLPGIVLGFAVTGVRAGLPMLLGAMLAGLAAVALIALVQKAARLDGAAAIGAVFTTFFAIGLVLLEVSGARSVDLDLDCVLFGQLETLVWTEGRSLGALFDPAALAALPRQLGLVVIVAAVVAASVAVFWRPLKLICFDPDYARALGIPARRFELGLAMLVAAAAVAAFEAVGSILVVALLVCPAAALRLMTDRYNTQVLGGAAVGAGLGAVGYALAGPVPALFGSTIALNAAGVIGALAGLLVAVAGLLYGVRPRRRGSAAPGSAPAAG